MKKFLQKLFIKYLVERLFRAVTPEDILQIDISTRTPRCLFHGKQLDNEQVSVLKENAENFEKSLLWRFMENRIRLESQQKMFPASNVDTDLIFGKAMLFNLDVIKTVIREIKNIP